MKKSVALLLAFVLTISCTFVACSSKNDDTKPSESGLGNQDEIGFEYVDVTDEDGKKVTDKDGKNLTTDVAVKYVKDKDGNTVAKVIDSNGEVVTDKNGKDVTVKTDYDIDGDKTPSTDGKVPTTKKRESTTSTTAPTNKGDQTTEKEITTKENDVSQVPLTSATGTPVNFSSEDQQIIKNMLEVPYLYTASYENRDEGGVPIEIATHTAIWMAEREGLKTSTYASGTIVLDLFKYYGQTVVNFKTKCNEHKNGSTISYNSGNDTFTITDFENPTHTVSINKIEDLGINNYFKVTASVSGAKGISTVYAIVQKNKLDSTLGFSIKALNWK